MATMESIGDPAETSLGGPPKDAVVAESGNGGLGGPSGYDGGYVGTADRPANRPPLGGPGGEGAPEREGGGLGGCCASARLRITEVRIWLNQVSSHSPARYDRSAPPDASPAASSALPPLASFSSAIAASRPSRVQSETNHPSPPAGLVASNGGGAGPSSPLCATTPPLPFAPPE